MKSSYFSGTGAGAKVPATQLALARLVVVVLLLVALVAAACNSWFLMWLSLREVTGGITRYLSRVRNNPPFPAVYKATRCNSWPSKRLPWGHCLSALPGSPWQAPAMASKVVQTGHLINDRLQHVFLSKVKDGTAKLRRPKSDWTGMLCHEVRQATCKGSVLKGSRGGCLSATAPIITHRIYALANQYMNILFSNLK